MLTTAFNYVRGHAAQFLTLVLLMLVGALIPSAAHAMGPHGILGMIGVAGMVIIPWQPTLDYDELTDASSPAGR